MAANKVRKIDIKLDIGTARGWSHVGFQDSAEGAILEVL